MPTKTRHLKQKKKKPQVQQAVARHDAPDVAEPDTMSPVMALEALRRPETKGMGALQQRAARHLGPLMGNSMLQRVLEAEETGDVTTIPDDAMPADMADFLKRGVMPGPNGLDVTPTGIGGFNAKFDPNSRELIITLNIGIAFIHGLQIDPATSTVSPDGAGLDLTDADEQGTLAELQTAADQINTDVPAADRQAIVDSQWRWGGEEDTWMTQYQTGVQSAWGGKHFFVSQDWPQLMSNVRVNVNVHRGNDPKDHAKGKIIKTAPGGIGAYVQSGSTTNANDQELIMSSTAVDPRPDNLLHWRLFFAHDSAKIEEASSEPDGAGDTGPVFLNKFIKTFNAAPGNAGQKIQLIGHASSSGSPQYNQKLSEQRAAAVEAFLKSNGLTGSVDRTVDSGTGEEGEIEAGSSRRVDMIIGSGEAQVVANHESGHLLGLDDEYSTDPAGLIRGTGNPIGSSVAHSDIDADALADAPIDGAVAENNDNIMSLGNTVRPQHYATFHAALEQVTGKSWRYGGEGDAPDVIPGTPVPGGVVT
jgi:flagellar motor protein MotB